MPASAGRLFLARQDTAAEDHRNSTANVNDLKDMLASLPQFQTQREQFSLHLDMAQECMSLFEKKKLNVAAHVEQVCLSVQHWPVGG